jgi:hypothetical protein
MTTFRYIRKVTPLEGRVLAIEWADGSRTKKDMSDLIRKRLIFRPLKDARLFTSVRVINDGRAIQWTDDIDYCADALWAETCSQVEQERRKLAEAG